MLGPRRDAIPAEYSSFVAATVIELESGKERGMDRKGSHLQLSMTSLVMASKKTRFFKSRS